MNKILQRLGQDPQRSLALFLRGLGLFSLGVCFVFVGYCYHHFWQIAGIVFLAIGILFSIWGYTGIFANRLLNMFNHSANKRDW